MLKACSISKFGNWCCHSPSRRLKRTLYEVLLFLPWCLRPRRWENQLVSTQARFDQGQWKKKCSQRDPLWTSDGLSYQRYLFPYAMFARHQSWHAFNSIIFAYADTLWPGECTTSSKAVVLKHVTIEKNTVVIWAFVSLRNYKRYWSFSRPLSCIWPNICHIKEARSHPVSASFPHCLLTKTNDFSNQILSKPAVLKKSGTKRRADGQLGEYSWV